MIDEKQNIKNFFAALRYKAFDITQNQIFDGFEKINNKKSGYTTLDGEYIEYNIDNILVNIKNNILDDSCYIDNKDVLFKKIRFFIETLKKNNCIKTVEAIKNSPKSENETIKYLKEVISVYEILHEKKETKAIISKAPKLPTILEAPENEENNNQPATSNSLTIAGNYSRTKPSLF
jgi:hypothetical protein